VNTAGLRATFGDPAVRVIVPVVFVVMLGFGIVVPILPLFARSFGVGYGAAGLLISVFAFARLVVGPFAGPLVDRWGERASMAIGVTVVGVSSLLTGLAPTYPLAVILRGSGGAGSALLFTAMVSYLLKTVPKARMGRTLGLFYGSFNLGLIAGAPLGGVIAEQLGLASPLFVYAGLLFVSGAMYLWRVRNPEATRAVGSEGSTPRAGVRTLLRRRAFLTTIVLNFSYLWMVGAVFDTLVPLFGQEGLGMSLGAIGVVFSVALGTELVVLYPAGSAADRLGRRPVVIPSMAALAILVAAVGLAPSPPALGALMALLGIASGFAGVPPGAMLADVAPGERSGTAVGIFRFAGDVGFVFGPLVGGFAAAAFGFRAAFWIAAIPIVVALILAVRTPETLLRSAEPTP
jgi:DHA1 family multidrug resistance protein-like MFS transporter